MGLEKRLQYQEVEALRVGRFYSRINTTCIIYRLGSTVIDTGPPNQWQEVKTFLNEKEVKQVLLTHHHEDHGGNGYQIQKEMQASIMAHQSGLERLAKGYHLEYYETIVWGKPHNFRAEPLPDKLNLDNGLELQAIYAPGHSLDMTCYLETEKGWLFTGDTYIANRPRYIRRDEEPLTEIKSLKKLLNYDFDTLFCAHRGIISNGHEALRKKLAFLENLRDEAQALQKEGRSIKEITTLLLGKEEIISWLTFFHFSKRNLIRALVPKV